MAVEVMLEVLEHGAGLPLPSLATEGSSGVDLMAAIDAPVILEPGERLIVPTGIKVSIPRGFEWQIRPRSGNAAKHGVTVLNTPGTIDSDYRGEVGIILINHGQVPFEISRGDRIAQAVLAPVEHPLFRTVTRVSNTARGEGGFGHSGK